jgi:hypothetical protein
MWDSNASLFGMEALESIRDGSYGNSNTDSMPNPPGGEPKATRRDPRSSVAGV